MGAATEWPCQAVVNDVLCTAAMGGSVLELSSPRASNHILRGQERSPRMQSSRSMHGAALRCYARPRPTVCNTRLKAAEV
jgi:hypothetical protein